MKNIVIIKMMFIILFQLLATMKTIFTLLVMVGEMKMVTCIEPMLILLTGMVMPGIKVMLELAGVIQS